MALAWAAVFFGGASLRVLADCSSFGLPFTDLGSTSFCSEIAEAYYSGLTNGTSATTYNPGGNVSRVQMAAFITRTLDQSLLRGNRRAALDQWWTTTRLALTSVGSFPSGPKLLKSDGTDVWVPNATGSTVARVRIGDGKKLETWTAATFAQAALVAMGRVFVVGVTEPGNLYVIDPTQTAGAVTTLSSALGNDPSGIAFDGDKIWSANGGGSGAGSVSIINPDGWGVTTVSTGFNHLAGIVFDGNNIWVTDNGAGKLFRLDSGGAIVASATVGSGPLYPAFDGHNIWVPNQDDNSLTVVRASDGAVLKTFASHANGLNAPVQAAFDGQRILVTNNVGGLSLFKAADLSAIRSVAATGGPFGVCSDGVNFWISFFDADNIGRF
jgi:hypothetical protein